MDIEKIEQVLTMAPLCPGTLIKGVDGGRVSYCALGALARAAGMPQERLRELANGSWSELYALLEAEYGLPTRLAEEIPGWNDGAILDGFDPAQRVLNSLKFLDGFDEDLSTGTSSGRVEHDDHSQKAGEKAPQAAKLGGGNDDPSGAPDDTDEPSGSRWGDTADGGALGSGPDGPDLQTAAYGSRALAPHLAQASG